MKKDNLTIKLPDGRQLGYAEYGDPDGHPVFYFHGTPGSRLQAADFHDAAQAKHCRFFGIDRLGMGLSSENKQHTLLSWTDDIRELANHLNINQFSIVAHSGGAPFAMACAYAIPERINSIAIVSGLAPTTMPEAKEGLSRGMRIINVLIRNIPGMAWVLIQVHRSMLSKPDRFKRSLQQLPEPDRIILENPEQWSSMISAATEAFRQGVAGPAREFQLILNAWGFDLRKITCPVTIWQGRLDSQVPVSHAEIYKRLLLNSELKLSDEDAHLSMLYHHVEEVFESVRPQFA
jgi:pimeloyl-ACP methyl ester carboxylesterase